MLYRGYSIVFTGYYDDKASFVITKFPNREILHEVGCISEGLAYVRSLTEMQEEKGFIKEVRGGKK